MRPGLLDLSPGIENGRPIFKKHEKSKKLGKGPEFKIFEDGTATYDNFTKLRDTDYSFYMNDIHDFIKTNIQREGPLYGEEVVHWILPLAKKLIKEQHQLAGRTTREVEAGEEMGLFSWNTTARQSDPREAWSIGRGGIARDGKESISYGPGGKKCGIKRICGKFTRGQKGSKTLMVCGCRGGSYGWETRRAVEYYERLGNAWTYIVDYHFDVDALASGYGKGEGFGVGREDNEEDSGK
jgi:hypothetical protein